MKYKEVVYIKNNYSQKINIEGVLAEKLETMEKEGEFLCSGNKCHAKLCLVHNSKNGGRTCFLKAVDDEKHHPECEYKIDNYKARYVTIRTDGVYTEKQVNDAVRRIANDYMKPLNPAEKGKKKKEQKNNSGSKTVKEDAGKKANVTAVGGRIIYGDESGQGIAGRMRRRYQVSGMDIGTMTTICGNAETVDINKHGELVVSYKEERLKNIQVILGSIYEHNNPTEFHFLYLAKQYFDLASRSHNVKIAAGGLVNTRNGKLILDVQANGALRVDGKTIKRMMVENAKRNL